MVHISSTSSSPAVPNLFFAPCTLLTTSECHSPFKNILLKRCTPNNMGCCAAKYHITTSTTTTTTTLFKKRPFSRTTWVSRHQKGKPFWILLKQEMTGWQWHQLDHMEIICTSHQTDKHASTSPLSFYRPDALPAAQTTVSKHWRL